MLDGGAPCRAAVQAAGQSAWWERRVGSAQLTPQSVQVRGAAAEQPERQLSLPSLGFACSQCRGETRQSRWANKRSQDTHERTELAAGGQRSRWRALPLCCGRPPCSRLVCHFHHRQPAAGCGSNMLMIIFSNSTLLGAAKQGSKPGEQRAKHMCVTASPPAISCTLPLSSAALE